MASASSGRFRVLCISPAHPPNDPRVLKIIRALGEKYEVRSLLPWRVTSSMGVLPFYPKLAVRLVLVHPLVVWHLLRYRPRIVHLFMPELLPIALLFRFLGGQVVYEVQENHRLKFDRKPRNKHPIFQRFFNWFDGLARRYCHFVFTEDSYLSEYDTLGLPHAVVHNFAEMSAQMSSPKRDRGRPSDISTDLCYLGLISNDRGLDTMLAVLDYLKSSRLHLFGRISDTPFPPQDRVILYGHVAQEIAFPLMSRCVAGLALLKPVGDYRDSYPTKLFEYMALGLPVIASDFPLYRSVIATHKCGFCVDPTDVVAIAARITWLIAHPEEAQRMGENGWQAVRDFYNWKLEAKKLLELYQNIDFK